MVKGNRIADEPCIYQTHRTITIRIGMPKGTKPKTICLSPPKGGRKERRRRRKEGL